MHADHDLSQRPLPAGDQSVAVRRKPSGILAFALATSLIAACGGGGGGDAATTSTADSGSPVLPILTTTSAGAMVVMPAGVSMIADKLSVLSSIGASTPDVSGAVTVPVYANGEQLAIVQSPAGNPMLMGWLDATHTTISAATTAHVLAYFALNGPQILNDADRHALIAQIPQTPGITAVESVVQSELAANVDAFAQRDAALASALADFAAPLYVQAHAAAAAAGRAKALGLSVNPTVAQSGIEVIQDPPASAHLTNSARRRAYAFVDRVSHTIGGVDVPDPGAVTEFEIKPSIGVSGGVTGAVTDIIGAYFGNQPTAYASITAPDSGSFAVPAQQGTDKTTYQVTVVGAGAHAGVSASLTDAQSAALTQVALKGFAADFFMPLIGNAVMGSGAINFGAGQSGPEAEFIANALSGFISDFMAFAPTVPDLVPKLVDGKWFDASVDLTTSVEGSSTLRTMLIKAFTDATSRFSGGTLTTSPMLRFLKGFDKALNAAGGVLQVFDSGAYSLDVGTADRADQWSIVAIPEHVTLNPAASNTGADGSVTLTASVLGVEDTAGYSFHWTTTTQVGDLNEVAGGSRMHQSDYCSSSPKSTFVAKTDATPGATDTVTVQIYSGANCDLAKGSLLGTAQATVTYTNNPWLGTWVGSVVSTCGFYSGALTYVITSGGDNVLNIVFNGSGNFSATYSGNTATAGDVLTMTLSGNTISLIETDSCQTASFTRQQ